MNLLGLQKRRIIMTLLVFGGLILLFLLAKWVDAQQTSRLIDDAVPLPVYSHPSGTYSENIAVTLFSPINKAQLIFTVDGTMPEVGIAPTYENPIVLRTDLPGVTVIRARTVLEDGRLSEPITNSYIVGMNTSLPILSVVMEIDDLWRENLQANNVFMMAGRAWERPSRVTYFDENGRVVFDVGAGIRLHGQVSRLFDKKSYRLYFRNQYGNRRLNYPLFAGNPIVSFDDLVIHNGGQDSYAYSANWTLLRTNLMSHLARNVNAYSTYNQPVLFFLNGEMLGIYNIRERMKETFFKDHYGLDGVEIVDSLYRNEGNEDYLEAVEDWRDLNNYAETNDLADPEHYATMQSRIDVANLIDHYILQMYGANTDWPHFNERVFRADDGLGKWHWALWDVDYNFGMFPASSVNENMVTWVMASERPEIHFYTRMFRAMMANPEFRNQFFVRSADLFNTTLSTENVKGHIDTLAAEIRPDIGYEIARWSSPGNWEQSILELNQFAAQRPDLMREHYVDGFGLAGTAVLTINPSEDGTVLLNESWFPERPFMGTYFQETTIQLRAIADDGFQLTGWQIDGEWVEADTAVLEHTMTQDSTITPRFERMEEGGSLIGAATFVDYNVDGWQTGMVCETSASWLQFRVNEATDLRGWRLTDNDSLQGDAEGSLIFADVPEFATVPAGTRVTVVLPETAVNIPSDDLKTSLLDKEITLHAGNVYLDATEDIGFRPVAGDSVVLLASTADGEQAVTMVAIGEAEDDLLFAQFGLPETAVADLDTHYCP